MNIKHPNIKHEIFHPLNIFSIFARASDDLRQLFPAKRSRNKRNTIMVTNDQFVSGPVILWRFSIANIPLRLAFPEGRPPQTRRPNCTSVLSSLWDLRYSYYPQFYFGLQKKNEFMLFSAGLGAVCRLPL